MRLTKKVGNIYIYNFDKDCDAEEREMKSIEVHNEIVSKLGQLEDIEEELGIDLITLFKILKTKECYSKEDGVCFIAGIDKNGVILMPKAFPFNECEFTRPFKGYGKTWALTKEELL